MHPAATGALLALQTFQVLFLALHDWVPLGRLNNLKGVHTVDSRATLVRTTVLSTAPYAFGLTESAAHWGRPYPGWLVWWLWVSYGLLFVGQLMAWWIPYLVRQDAARAARYKVMFAGTHSLLPERNGIRVNTLHVILHAATLCTLVLLGLHAGH